MVVTVGVLYSMKSDHKSLEQTVSRAYREVYTVPGYNLHRHKKSGGEYRALSVSLRETDLTPLVNYCADKDLADRIVFSRPLEEFKLKFEYIGPR